MRILSRIGLAALLVGLAAGPVIPAAQAEEMQPLPTSVAAATSVDRSHADIVQLSNLTVDAIEYVGHTLGAPSGTSLKYEGLLAIVTATAQQATCKRYILETSERSMPCLAVMARQYQIRVGTDTKVLDRNRRSAGLESVAVGDAVNVFGYVNSATGLIDARILRDLDKPAVTREVQLDGLTVMSVTAAGDTLELSVGRMGGLCYQFTAGRKLPYDCPTSTQPGGLAPMQSSSMGSTEVRYPIDYVGWYQVSVPKGALVLDANRKPLARSAIRMGDTVNVAGTVTDGSGRIVADVVRVTAHSR